MNWPACWARNCTISLNNTWLNYAIPIDELRQSVEEIRAGKFVARRDAETEKKPQRSLTLASLGIELVPDVLERTPAYVDRVRPGSAAAKAGIRPDDLIELVGRPSGPIVQGPGDGVGIRRLRGRGQADGAPRPEVAGVHAAVGRRSEAAGEGTTMMSRDCLLLPYQDGQAVGIVALGLRVGNCCWQFYSSPLQYARLRMTMSAQEQAALAAAVDRVAPAVVQIETIGGQEQVRRVLFGTGPTTGLVVDPEGYIVSSAFNFVEQARVDPGAASRRVR